MPNIPEYESHAADQGLHPSDIGAEAYAQEGRRVGQLFREAGSALQDATDRWQHQVTVQSDLTTLKLQSQRLVQRQQDWTQAVQDDATKPVHNANLLADFQQKWQAEDEAYISTLPTKEAKSFATERAISQQQHFSETGMADMGSLAGHQAALDMREHGIYNQTAAYNDPTAADHLRGSTDAALDVGIRTLGPNAGVGAIETLREEAATQKTAITLAQARGTVDHAVDPLGGAPGSGIGPAIKTFLESPAAKTYLNGEQASQITEYAERQAKARQQDQWMAQEHEHRQAEWSSQSKVGQYQAILGGAMKPGGSLPADFTSTVMKDPTLLPSDRDTLVGLAHRMQTDAANVETKPGLLHSMLSRVTLPETDQNHLTQNEVMQHIGVDVSKADGDFLLERLKPAAEAHDRATNIMLDQTLREARAALVPHDQLANLDPSVRASEEHTMSTFETWFIGAYQDGLKGGKTPEQLLNSTSPDYLLKGDRIQSFVPKVGQTNPGPAAGSARAPIGGHPPDQNGKKIDISGAIGAIAHAQQTGTTSSLPPASTGGISSAPARTPTLSQQEVDGILFGKTK